MLALLLSASALAAVALVAVLPSAHAPRGPPDPAGALTAAMPAAPPCTAGSSGTQQLRLCVAPDSQPTAEPPGPPAVTKQAPEAMLEGRWWPGATANSSSGRLPQIATWGASAATVAFADATALTITINGSMDRPGLYDGEACCHPPQARTAGNRPTHAMPATHRPAALACLPSVPSLQ